MTEFRVDFIGDVVGIVSPLVEPYGYVPAAYQYPNSVGFESTTMETRVTWNVERDNYVFVELKERRARAIPLLLKDVYSVCGVSESRGPDAIASRDYAEVLEFVRSSTNVLVQQCGAALVGDRSTLDRISEQIHRQAQANLEEIVTRQARMRADRAWSERRFGDFVAACSSIGKSLTRTEAAKVAYAKRKLAEGAE